MARRFPLTSVQRMSEINLTSVMDLTFLLLITFIITFPLLEQGIPVNLPKASARELPADKSSNITVDKKGLVYLNEVRMDTAQLRARLADLKRSSPDLSVLIRADEAVVYGKVVEVLRVLNGLQITKMSLVTEAESR